MSASELKADFGHAPCHVSKVPKGDIPELSPHVCLFDREIAPNERVHDLGLPKFFLFLLLLRLGSCCASRQESDCVLLVTSTNRTFLGKGSSLTTGGSDDCVQRRAFQGQARHGGSLPRRSPKYRGELVRHAPRQHHQD